MPDTEASLHESFRHYRGAAIGLSATLIALSGAVFVKLEGVQNLPAWQRRSGLILFAVVVFLALLMQYFHFKGYHLFAQAAFLQEDELRKTQNAKRIKDYRARANCYFGYLDRITVWAFWLFVILGLLGLWAVWSRVPTLPR